MSNNKRYFKFIIEEEDGGSGVVVSANADRNYILRNIIDTMLSHELLYELLTTAAGAALFVKEKAAELGITDKELIERVKVIPGYSDADSFDSEKLTQQPVSEKELIEPKDQALIDEMKNILNGGK